MKVQVAPADGLAIRLVQDADSGGLYSAFDETYLTARVNCRFRNKDWFTEVHYRLLYTK
jgi:hypothetical protein